MLRDFFPVAEAECDAFSVGLAATDGAGGGNGWACELVSLHSLAATFLSVSTSDDAYFKCYVKSEWVSG